MSLSLEKIRGNAGFRFTYHGQIKSVVWEVGSEEVSVETLRDIVSTVGGDIQPTVPAIPPWITDLQQLPGYGITENPYPSNQGAEAADRAAREEEQRLMNMGSAISKGIGLGPEDIPVFDNGELPPVNWGA